MSAVNSQPPRTLTAGELDVRVNATVGKITLSWHGRSVAREPSAVLQPFFDTVIRNLNKSQELELDFRSFEFMNSSTLKPILTFVQAASAEARHVRVRYDEKRTWQRLSFKLLRAVSSTWTNVSVQGE